MISESKHILSSLQTLFIGDLHTYWFQLKTQDFFSIAELLITQFLYYFVYELIILLEWILGYTQFFKTMPVISSFFVLFKKVWKRIPIAGSITTRIHKEFKVHMSSKDNFVAIWKSNLESFYWNNLFKNSIDNKKAHIKLVITGDLDTQSILDLEHAKFAMSNHRSIFDYILLQYIFQKNKGGAVPNYMLLWGSVIKIPGFKTIIKMFQKNENHKIKANSDAINYNSKTPVIFFPEVNVMTNELKIVHDKMCTQNGTRIFKESLSPRYDAFLKLVDLVTISDNIDNEYFYNVTLTYYKLESVPLDESNHICLAHENDQQNSDLRNPLSWYKSVLNFNQTKLSKFNTETPTKRCKYQLLQITPSLLECFNAFNRSAKQPLIIRVHIEKIPLILLQDKSKKKLELFLENKFAAKDDIIHQFESNLKIKRTKKRSIKNSMISADNESHTNTQENTAETQQSL